MHRNYSYNNHKNNPCKITALRIVYELDDVDDAINEVYKRCASYPVIGMDCEWIPTRKKNEQPDVSLLQIATIDGFCVLIRTCFMTELPQSLLTLMSSRKIIKVGVGIFNDGKVLHQKFQNCHVAGRLDIRFLSRGCNVYSGSESLKGLTKAILGFDLDKDNVLFYQWNACELDEETARYAALDALAGVKIFDKLLPLYHEQMSNEPLLPSRKLIERYFISTDPRSSCGRIFDRKFNIKEDPAVKAVPRFGGPRIENFYRFKDESPSIGMYAECRETLGVGRYDSFGEHPSVIGEHPVIGWEEPEKGREKPWYIRVGFYLGVLLTGYVIHKLITYKSCASTCETFSPQLVTPRFQLRDWPPDWLF